MKDSFSLNELTKTGQLLLCPNCQFRVSIINNYLSSNTNNAKQTSQLLVNSICYDNNHKIFSNDYINGFNNTVHYCVNHENKVSNYYCTKCNCFYCDRCADEHEKQKADHVVSLFMEKSKKRCCYKHQNEVASFKCKECNEIFCDKCNDEHKEHNISNELINKDKDKNEKYTKEMLLDIKKTQANQIETLVKQLLNAKEEIQFEILEIEEQL